MRVQNSESYSTTIEHVRFRTTDAFELAGTTFTPPHSRATVLVNAGTGIPRYFYAHFATWLAEQGFAVLTYDYRGIGDSVTGPLKELHATKSDWARRDMTAAFARQRREHADIPHFVFGHSVGGQLLFMMDGVEAIDAVATYGSGFGYWGALQGAYRYFVLGMWRVGIPLGTSLFGYMPAKRLGLGEDLPAGVARDWARWGLRADYFAGELGDQPGLSRLRAPWRAFRATDDRIATPQNAQGLINMYRRPIEQVQLAAADFGYEDLGHMKFFSRTRSGAWPVIADYFNQCLSGLRSSAGRLKRPGESE